MHPWACYPPSPKMAGCFCPLAKESFYPNAAASPEPSQAKALLPPPRPLRGHVLGGAKAPGRPGCCHPRRQRSSSSQQARLRRGKGHFPSNPPKNTLKIEAQKGIEDSTPYPGLPSSSLPSYSSPLIGGAGSPTQQAGEGAAPLAENRRGRNMQSHQDPAFIPSRCF